MRSVSVLLLLCWGSVASGEPVFVKAGSTYGRGTFVGNGLTIASGHVIWEQATATVTFLHKARGITTERVAIVILVSHADDFALLAVDAPSWAVPSHVVFRMPRFGESLLRDSTKGITKGCVMDFDALHGDAKGFSMEGQAAPGDSGGGICDERGNLVGWTWGTVGRRTYAISAACLLHYNLDLSK
jgi:hypothetical protein